jgi:general stress protein YciG
MSTTHEKRSEAGRKGAQALKAKHQREGLTEAEKRQRSEAGKKGGQR